MPGNAFWQLSAQAVCNPQSQKRYPLDGSGVWEQNEVVILRERGGNDIGTYHTFTGRRYGPD